VLDDRTPIRIPDPAIRIGVFTEGASGVLTTIEDILRLYHSFGCAVKDQFQSKATSTANNPFVECATIVKGHCFMDSGYVIQEQTYGCGWIRSQLPAPLGMISINPMHTEMPRVLEGGPSHLCLYHQGLMAGSTSNITLIPETETVVAIWANASPLGDGIDWMSQMILEAIFEPPTRHNYEKLAEEVARSVLDHIPSMGRELDAKQTLGTSPSIPPESFNVGWNIRQ
jgi:hypothetical protein